MKPALPWIQKAGKDITREENYGLISFMSIDAKSLTKYQQTESNSILKKDFTAWLSGIYPKNTKMIQYKKIDQCNTH